MSGRVLIDWAMGLGKRDTGDVGPPSPADGSGDFGASPAAGDVALLLSPLPALGAGAAAPCSSWEAVLTVFAGLSCCRDSGGGGGLGTRTRGGEGL